MRYLVGLIGGLALTLAGSASAETSCAHNMVASIDAELGARNQLLIHATIDDQPVLLGVDTGASSSIMFESGVTRLGLSRIPTRSLAYGVDGRPLDEETTVPALALGRLVSRGTEFPISPLGRNASNMQEVGLFGADYLRNYDLEINLADHKVKLFSKQHCPGKVVYWSDSYNATDIEIGQSGQIQLPIELDGTRIDGIIDTGAAATALRLGTAHGRFGIADDSPGVIPIGLTVGVGGQPMQSYRYTFKTLKFGDLMIHNPQIDLVPFRETLTTLGSHIRTQMTPDILIGMSFLQHLRLYIAYDERKIYYTVAAPATAQPARAN